MENLSGEEGLADLIIIDAIEKSALTHQSIPLPGYPHGKRPQPQDAIKKPAHPKPKLVRADKPSKK